MHLKLSMKPSINAIMKSSESTSSMKRGSSKSILLVPETQ